MCDRQRRWLTTKGGLALSWERAPQAKDLVTITRLGSTPRRTGWVVTWHWPGLSLSRVKIIVIGASVLRNLQLALRDSMCAVAYPASVEDDCLSACQMSLTDVSISGAADSSSLRGHTTVLQEVYKFVIPMFCTLRPQGSSVMNIKRTE